MKVSGTLGKVLFDDKKNTITVESQDNIGCINMLDFVGQVIVMEVSRAQGEIGFGETPEEKDDIPVIEVSPE